MNEWVGIGRLTAKPEVEYKNGTAISKFTVAIDKTNKEADFIRVTCFGKTAENVARYKKKGEWIAVKGHISTGSYEKDGKRIYTMDVIVDRAEFIGNKTEEFKADTFGFKAESDGVPF